ncbi:MULTISPECIES: hypothetical protein [Rhizobium/Agrobacterium group]|uniref:hypothetical protein n=1 Tax=Rhizobium/Agrobacterium group TaxID=227290 RepID=UPI000B404262|nr:MULTISPECIES: hypothetical protein [Rhizobium/Agrobacterium group]MCF1464762.1 hypothetical protein [Allorhizobium ampelinum]MCF1495308.1 hypothetical protein [Allorhizobium ampelinum]MUZ55365.1 hypothetical protein [Agrobacterium vitis]MUZ94624.1 hypothetical protein [Agrobacterium vitis]MVA43180.1 hypothetical protein [Agrobacterium vitis]
MATLVPCVALNDDTRIDGGYAAWSELDNQSDVWRQTGLRQCCIGRQSIARGIAPAAAARKCLDILPACLFMSSPPILTRAMRRP